jgi:hypothetical protein
MRYHLIAASLLALVVQARPAAGQAMPVTQPSYVHVIREEVKTGRSADHARWEAGYVAASERAKDPSTYIALASMTGLSEVWYVTPTASNAVLGERLSFRDANAVYSTELDRLDKGDAEFVSSIRTLDAVARPDLSMGAFPDIAKMRFWEITLWRVRPGHEEQFSAGVKAYMSAAKRSAPNASWRTYEVIAGMTGPAYFVFSSVAAMGDLDKVAADGMATMKGATAEEMATLQKFSVEAITNSESNRYRLDPVQSYVPKETRAADPAFWMPKKAAAKP